MVAMRAHPTIPTLPPTPDIASGPVEYISCRVLCQRPLHPGFPLQILQILTLGKRRRDLWTTDALKFPCADSEPLEQSLQCGSVRFK